MQRVLLVSFTPSGALAHAKHSSRIWIWPGMTDQVVCAVEADDVIYRMSALESSAVLPPVLEAGGRSRVDCANTWAFPSSRRRPLCLDPSTREPREPPPMRALPYVNYLFNHFLISPTSQMDLEINCVPLIRKTNQLIWRSNQLIWKSNQWTSIFRGRADSPGWRIGAPTCKPTSYLGRVRGLRGSARRAAACSLPPELPDGQVHDAALRDTRELGRHRQRSGDPARPNAPRSLAHHR